MHDPTSEQTLVLHLWHTDPRDWERIGFGPWWRRLLTPDDLELADRAVHPRVRLERLVSPALTRVALADHLSIDPAAVRLKRMPSGRSVLDFPSAPPHLKCSLSHTDGLIALLVGCAPRLGFDVEHTAREIDFLESAESVFNPEELAALRSSSTPRRRELFFQLWTLKEATAKALDLGFSFDVRQVRFEMQSQGSIVAHFQDPGIEAEGFWTFFSQVMGDTHVAAGAVCHSAHVGLRLVTREIRPAALQG